MLQLGCSSPSHTSSTPASPNLFSPMCSTFKCLFTLRAELMALQQAVVSPHSLILQGKKWYEICMGDIEALFTSSHKPGQWEQRNQSFSTITVLLSTSYLLDPKQHLSHSLCLGCLSHSVHLGKVPAHKAHRDKACSSHSHSWLHGALLRHLINFPFSWGKELNLQHRKVQVLLLQFLCERIIFLSQSCDNRPSQSKR